MDHFFGSHNSDLVRENQTIISYPSMLRDICHIELRHKYNFWIFKIRADFISGMFRASHVVHACLILCALSLYRIGVGSIPPTLLVYRDKLLLYAG